MKGTEAEAGLKGLISGKAQRMVMIKK